MKHSNTVGILAMQLDEAITIHTDLMGISDRVVLPGKLRHINLDENRIDLGVQFTDLGEGLLKDLDRCIQQVLAIAPLAASADLALLSARSKAERGR